MDNKLKILSIFAVVFAVTLITATSANAQQIVNPTPQPKPNNSTGSVAGCQDGIVIYTSDKNTLNASKGINLACIVKPFNIKPFGSTNIIQENQNVKGICDFIKVFDKKFKCPKGLP